MGKLAVADEKISNHLTTISSDVGITPGLILGQRTKKKDFIVHLAPTPLPEGKGTSICKEHVGDTGELDIKCVKNLQDLEESWFTIHTRNVTRMLPGGMWVLGVFFVSPQNVFQDEKSINKIRSILTFVNKSTSSNDCLYGSTPDPLKLVFYFNATNQKYTCKGMDATNFNMAMTDVDWKFQKTPLKWHRVESSYSLNSFSNYDIHDENAKPLKIYMKDKLEKIKDEVEASACTVNGVFRENTDTLEDIKTLTEQQRQSQPSDSKNKKEDDESFKVFMYSLLVPPEDRTSKVVVQMTFGEMIFDGIVGSQVFLHEFATVEETVLAVKQDIVRSLASRLEMHWDSFEETDDKNDGKKIHEPPRRVLFKDINSGITFSDYMFKDDTCEDVAFNLQEQLGIVVIPSALNVSFELPYPGKKALPSKEDTESDENSRQPSETDGMNTTTVQSSNYLMFGIMGAVVVLLISLAVHFFT